MNGSPAVAHLPSSLADLSEVTVGNIYYKNSCNFKNIYHGNSS